MWPREKDWVLPVSRAMLISHVLIPALATDHPSPPPPPPSIHSVAGARVRARTRLLARYTHSSARQTVKAHSDALCSPHACLHTHTCTSSCCFVLLFCFFVFCTSQCTLVLPHRGTESTSRCNHMRSRSLAIQTTTAAAVGSNCHSVTREEILKRRSFNVVGFWCISHNCMCKMSASRLQ